MEKGCNLQWAKCISPGAGCMLGPFITSHGEGSGREQLIWFCHWRGSFPLQHMEDRLHWPILMWVELRWEEYMGERRTFRNQNNLTPIFCFQHADLHLVASGSIFPCLNFISRTCTPTISYAPGSLILHGWWQKLMEEVGPLQHTSTSTSLSSPASLTTLSKWQLWTGWVLAGCHRKVFAYSTVRMGRNVSPNIISSSTTDLVLCLYFSPSWPTWTNQNQL